MNEPASPLSQHLPMSQYISLWATKSPYGPPNLPMGHQISLWATKSPYEPPNLPMSHHFSLSHAGLVLLSAQNFLEKSAHSSKDLEPTLLKSYFHRLRENYYCTQPPSPLFQTFFINFLTHRFSTELFKKFAIRFSGLGRTLLQKDH
jgi:hypothetical protein